jgi:hypothetical protein
VEVFYNKSLPRDMFDHRYRVKNGKKLWIML